jgi:hypothetical protein
MDEWIDGVLKIHSSIVGYYPNVGNIFPTPLKLPFVTFLKPFGQ